MTQDAVQRWIDAYVNAWHTDQKALELVESKTFSTGVLYLTYQPAQT